MGAYVGFSPADRDASLLRAQLEPWSTTALRRRLVADFGRDPSDPEQSDRAAVVKELLECYAEEGLMLADGRSARRTVHVAGEAVPEADRSALLAELRRWAASVDNQHAGGRERPTVRARAYMILTSPAELQCGTAKALKAVAKLQAHAKLWELAVKALKRVDPDFADSFTALAVTSQFEGSPHIDKRNVGPFYGLALGDFANKTVKENDNDNEEEEGRGGGASWKSRGGNLRRGHRSRRRVRRHGQQTRQDRRPIPALGGAVRRRERRALLAHLLPDRRRIRARGTRRF